MKRYSIKILLNALLILYLAFCLLPVSALATNRTFDLHMGNGVIIDLPNTYDLDELGMSIDLPDDLIVFTRNIKSNDPNLSAYGLTKDGLSSVMLEQNVFLNAWDENVNYEITVTMIESPLEDFSQLSDTTLSVLASIPAEEYERVGGTDVMFDIYQHDQTKFIRITFSTPNNGSTVYGLQYQTVHDGKAINITLKSFSGKIGSSKNLLMKNIVDSVHFSIVSQPGEPPAQTAAFTYTDDKSGLSFTVPANWVEAPLNEERDSIDAKFVSNLEEGLSIFFSSTDLWMELTEADKKQLSRSDADNSVFTKADIAEICGCEISDISTTIFSGREYYCAEYTASRTAYGLTVSISVTEYIRFENGYMYTFQFLDMQDSQYYKDFEDLMSSIVYPQLDKNDTGKAIREQFSITNIFVNLIITVTVYSLPIIIYKFIIRKGPVDHKKAKRITIIYGAIAFILVSITTIAANGSGAASGAIFLWSGVNYGILVSGTKQKKGTLATKIDSSNAPPGLLQEDPRPISMSDEDVDDTVDDPNIVSGATENNVFIEEDMTFFSKITFCHRCGSKLIPNSLFCNKCGTKIPNAKELEEQ